jgi:hypothetical protein
MLSATPAKSSSGERYEIFKPLVPSQEELTANDAEFNYFVVARLKPGVSVQQAQSELDGIEKATSATDHLTIHLSVVVQPFPRRLPATSANRFGFCSLQSPVFCSWLA